MSNNDNTDEMKRVLRDFVAMERDRLLGYPSDELHRDPQSAMVDGMKQLIEAGDDPDELILPSDQEALDLDLNDD